MANQKTLSVQMMPDYETLVSSSDKQLDTILNKLVLLANRRYVIDTILALIFTIPIIFTYGFLYVGIKDGFAIGAVIAFGIIMTIVMLIEYHILHNLFVHAKVKAYVKMLQELRESKEFAHAVEISSKLQPATRHWSKDLIFSLAVIFQKRVNIETAHELSSVNSIPSDGLTVFNDNTCINIFDYNDMLYILSDVSIIKANNTDSDIIIMVHNEGNTEIFITESEE